MDIKKYDKRLCIVKKLDGTKTIRRLSPYSSSVEHDIINVENQYLGSMRWIRNKLIQLDTTRHDNVGRALRHNWALRENNRDDRAHRDIANFFAAGGESVLL